MRTKLPTALPLGWLLVSVAQAAQAQAHPATPSMVPPEIRACRPSAPIGSISGDVVLSFRVTAQGRVDSSTVRVVRANGISEAAALSAALRFVPGCRFTPARGPGGPVAVGVTQPIHFPESDIPLTALPSDSLRLGDEAPAAVRCQLSTLLTPRVVVVTFIIGVDGKPEAGTVHILSMTTPTSLKVAEAFVASCRYAPGRIDGVPVRVLVQQPFVIE
jgi:TonB family protein